MPSSIFAKSFCCNSFLRMRGDIIPRVKACKIDNTSPYWRD